MKLKTEVALTALGILLTVALSAGAATAEYNPVPTQPLAVGPEAGRFIVGFRTTTANAVTQTVHSRAHAKAITSTQARTSVADVDALTQRVGIATQSSRQLTPSMHVMLLKQTLYGADVGAALTALRADPAVKFAEVDQRRYPHAVPDDPLYPPTSGAAGQWYLMTPDPSGDASATDAVSAWALSTGSAGTVIADIDTGIRFEHPDLLRAGFGGRLLPGYDFVAGDESTSGRSLGTFLTANDGDGWDPDPSDPGDWITASDQSNALFPSADCAVADSSWHGTRVMGILGALTNNAVGIAGMTWQPYLLPVRALGKCGGYDSDIIAGMQWAAGLSVTGVPDNPYPADIVNLSLGGSGACPADYADAVDTLTGMGVLIVASAGNESGAVDAPGNCPGVLAVAGLRNVGTKVGYSSLGPEVGVAAPAGNCINSSGACLKPIDTTSNTGLTVPAASSYTNETNPNLGTSFSAPIVAGIAAQMRAVNANLTPAQLIARIKAGAVTFPQPTGIPVCPATAVDASGVSTGECACPTNGSECGAGMVNALNAVTGALRPIAAVAVTTTSGGATFDAGGSVAACGRTLTAYAWSETGAVALTGGAAAAKATASFSGAGTLTLTVTDSAGAIDTVTLSVAANGTVTAPAGTPTTAGSGASACPTAMTITPVAPSVSMAFSPASVGENTTSTLTLTLANANAFVLTQAALTESLPANLTLPTSSAIAVSPGTTCSGAQMALTSTATSVTLTGANIPASSSCTVTIPLQSAVAGSYLATVAVGALSTGPAGSSNEAASATLTVSAPSKGGGGALDWWDTLFVVGVLLAGRRHTRRRPPGGS